MGKKFLVFFMLLIVISSGLIGCFGEEKYGPLIRENSVPEEKKQSKEVLKKMKSGQLCIGSWYTRKKRRQEDMQLLV